MFGYTCKVTIITLRHLKNDLFLIKHYCIFILEEQRSVKNNTDFEKIIDVPVYLHNNSLNTFQCFEVSSVPFSPFYYLKKKKNSNLRVKVTFHDAVTHGAAFGAETVGAETRAGNLRS